jgi:hypothetical protein
LADTRRSSPHFKTTVLTALQFLKEHDPRRFARVQRYITWIVNCALELGAAAEYNYEIRTCSIDFQEPPAGSAPGFSAALYARTLVHEATHGLVKSRHIPYTPELRARIEGLCVAEENRFVCRVGRSQPELAKHLRRQFATLSWQPMWTASRWQRVLAVLKNFPRHE